MHDGYLLIDTDLGDDLDDALALATVLHYRLPLLGVTTVFQDTDARARMVRRLLRAYGREYAHVPVLAGHGIPLEGPSKLPKTLTLSEAEGAEDLHPDNEDPDAAVDFIIRAARTHGAALTVACLGPLTNLALALQRDPAAFSGGVRVILMGGAYFKHYADWNFLCDPQAASYVLSHLSNVICIGADVTHQTAATERFTARLIVPSPDAPAWRQVLAEYALRWGVGNGRWPVLHDPLVIAQLLDPSLCELEKARIAVLTEGPARALSLNVDAYGKSGLNPYYDGHAPLPIQQVARTVDLDRLHAVMEAVLEE